MSMNRIDCRDVDAIEGGKLYFHPNAVYEGDCYEGCCEKFSCPDCHTQFRVEQPQ